MSWTTITRKSPIPVKYVQKYLSKTRVDAVIQLSFHSAKSPQGLRCLQTIGHCIV